MRAKLFHGTLVFWFVFVLEHYTSNGYLLALVLCAFPFLFFAWCIAIVRWLVGPRQVRVELPAPEVTRATPEPAAAPTVRTGPLGL